MNRNRFFLRLTACLLGMVLCFSLGCREISAQDGISAQAYIVMDALTGEIVTASGEQEMLPIASTTKILTALITLEQDNLDEYFTVDSEAIKIEGSSMGLVEGDSVSLRMLAYGMLLPSGNDAANAAAVRIAGSVEEFAEMMNARAAEIGMENSHFVTPSGLHDDDHASTAYDMALLTREALNNPYFLEISSSAKAQVSFGNPPFDRWLSNHNRLLKSYEGCIGVKTGFTKKAGRCLVTAAQRDGARFICVTLNAPNDWSDHTALLDQGFSTVREVELAANLEGMDLPVVGSERSRVTLSPVSEFTVKTTAAAEDIIQEVYLDPFLYAPVAVGDVVGEVRFTAHGKVLAATPVTAAEEAAYQEAEIKPGLWERFMGLFGKK